MDRQVQDIIVERPAAGLVQITLHRPEFRNALRTQTLAEIAAELATALADPETKVVVLTGGVDCFAAGADVREMAPLGPIDILTHERQRNWRAIAAYEALVGAVRLCAGGGCELALRDIPSRARRSWAANPRHDSRRRRHAALRAVGKALTMQVLTGSPSTHRRHLPPVWW
jgi:enoyl-CoA hydratase